MNRQISTATAKGPTTRDRILNAARKSLIERGIDRFALREIADSLEIKLGNLQYYFKTRDALVIQVLEKEAERDRTLIKSHQQKIKDPGDAFRAIVQDLISRWRGDSGVLFATLSTMANHNKAYRKLYRSIYADFYLELEKPLRVMNPGLSKSEIALRARLITALIDGAPMQSQIANQVVFLQRIQEQAESIARA
ncbi:MAG: helix-turn-helix domain-containing protein [Pseudomonadota bacterium]